jgi:hypothetical protein
MFHVEHGPLQLRHLFHVEHLGSGERSGRGRVSCTMENLRRFLMRDVRKSSSLSRATRYEKEMV